MQQTKHGYADTTLAENGIATLTFFHPAHNSLSSALLNELVTAIDALGQNPTVKVIVLGSAEHNTFCAGASFDELASLRDVETSQQFFSGFGRIINAMRRCPKIIVARVHGKAVGGGVGLAAAADYCMASHYAAIRLSELAVGFGPFVIGPAVERKIGVSAFSQMSLLPTEWQTAEWAKSKGLFQEVFDTTAQLDAYMAHFCVQMCGYSPAALGELKRIFWQGTEHWDTLLTERAAISGRLALAEPAQTAIAAFKAR